MAMGLYCPTRYCCLWSKFVQPVWQLALQFANNGSVMYIKRKGSIAGPLFKIPLMGPFIQALHPKFEGYLAQWASGPLSCVSVFHKYANTDYNTFSSEDSMSSSKLLHVIPQVHRPCFGSRFSPQSFQIADLHRALYSSHSERHSGSQSLGLSSG